MPQGHSNLSYQPNPQNETITALDPALSWISSEATWCWPWKQEENTQYFPLLLFALLRDKGRYNENDHTVNIGTGWALWYLASRQRTFFRMGPLSHPSPAATGANKLLEYNCRLHWECTNCHVKMLSPCCHSHSPVQYEAPFISIISITDFPQHLQNNANSNQPISSTNKKSPLLYQNHLCSEISCNVIPKETIISTF